MDQMWITDRPHTNTTAFVHPPRFTSQCHVSMMYVTGATVRLHAANLSQRRLHTASPSIHQVVANNRKESQGSFSKSFQFKLACLSFPGFPYPCVRLVIPLLAAQSKKGKGGRKGEVIRWFVDIHRTAAAGFKHPATLAAPQSANRTKPKTQENLQKKQKEKRTAMTEVRAGEGEKKRKV